MTNKEALVKVRGYLTDLLPIEDYGEVEEIMAALEQQPCEIAISKQKVIDEIEYELEMINSALDSMTLDFNAREILRQRRGEAMEILNSIQQLPPVTPQPKTGHWIIVDDCEHFIAKCSECGRIEDSRMINKYPYCHCGAKMKLESDNI